MSTQSDKLPPLPINTPFDEKGGKPTSVWNQWFIRLKAKVDSINTSLVNLLGTNSAGFLATDGNGNWFARKLVAGTGISISNTTGAAGNPTFTVGASGGNPLTVTTNTAASYTVPLTAAPASSSNIGWIESNNTNSNSINIDVNTNVPFPVGTHIYVRQVGTGATFLQGLTGVTFTGPTITAGAQYSIGELIQIAINTWAVFGNLAYGAGTSYSAVVMGLTPLAYYRLGETSGTTAADSSGNAYNGTYEGTVTLGAASLILNNSGNLAVGGDGTSAYVKVGGPTALYGLNRDFTVTAWIKPNFTTSGQQSGIWSSGYQGFCIRCDWNGTALQFEILSDYSTSLYTWTTTIGNNTTTFVAITCSSTGVFTLYINGAAFGSTYTYSGTFTGTGLVVGADSNYPGTPGDYLFGELDEVAAFNYALTSTQVANLYSTGT